MKSAESLPIELNRRRIYILPTLFGLGFAVMLMIMLFGALNYANNAAMLLTCLLAAACTGSMLSTFGSLDRLQLRGIRMGTANAGEPILVRLEFAAGARPRMGIQIRVGGRALPLAIDADAAGTLEWSIPTEQRGWMPLPGLRVHSTWPFGLFQAWSWLHPRQSALVYPRLETHGPPPGGEDASSPQLMRDGDELAALREYRAGDAMKLIAWKASARHHDLLTREFEQPTMQQERLLDWHALGNLGTEARIARLARWVSEAHAADQPWTLVLPRDSFGPAAGAEHYHRCMCALAQLP